MKKDRKTYYVSEDKPKRKARPLLAIIVVTAALVAVMYMGRVVLDGIVQVKKVDAAIAAMEMWDYDAAMSYIRQIDDDTLDKNRVRLEEMLDIQIRNHPYVVGAMCANEQQIQTYREYRDVALAIGADDATIAYVDAVCELEAYVSYNAYYEAKALTQELLEEALSAMETGVEKVLNDNKRGIADIEKGIEKLYEVVSTIDAQADMNGAYVAVYRDDIEAVADTAVQICDALSTLDASGLVAEMDATKLASIIRSYAAADAHLEAFLGWTEMALRDAAQLAEQIVSLENAV